MISATFPEATYEFGPPPDLSEQQCNHVAVFVGSVPGGSCDGAPMVITAWRPSQEELAHLNQGGLVFLTCLGGLPPHFLSSLAPSVNDLVQVQAVADELAAAGIVVSFVFGPCGQSRELIWSVDVLTPNRQTFDRPFAARTLTQAAEIARLECAQRGWLAADA